MNGGEDVTDRETFENASEGELAELSVPDQVRGFLAAHKDRAFKAREVASQVGLDGYSGYERATALFNERLGAEETAAWREHAPDEPHPTVDSDQEP